MRYFLDNTFSPRLAEILRVLGVDAVHLQDMFPPDTWDPDWIGKLRDGDWVALTGDTKQLARIAEVQAIVDAGLSAFFFYKSFTKKGIWEQFAFFASVWPSIVKAKVGRGECYHVRENCRIEKINMQDMVAKARTHSRTQPVTV